MRIEVVVATLLSVALVAGMIQGCIIEGLRQDVATLTPDAHTTAVQMTAAERDYWHQFKDSSGYAMIFLQGGE